jgi:hypothetical protein
MRGATVTNQKLMRTGLILALLCVGMLPRATRAGDDNMEQLQAMEKLVKSADRPDCPELAGASAWINTEKPITLADLKGKVVLLDFWTFG